MSLEEPDTATVGAAPPDPESPGARDRRLMRVLGVAAVTVVVAVAIGLVIAGRNDRPAGRAVATRAITSAPSAVGIEVDAPTAPPAAPEEPPAQVPGLPLVAVGPADASGSCTASWTADDGGSAILRFEVRRESAPAPPGPEGTEIGTALQVERTTDTTGTVARGATISVRAENAQGFGPATEPIVCA